MRARIIILLVMAIGIGFGTVHFTRQWLDGQRVTNSPTPVAAETHSVRVLVAAASLPMGRFVKPEDLRWQDWPEDATADTYFIQGQVQIEDLIGAVTRQNLEEGEPITNRRIVRPGERGFLAAVLTPGMRAIAVPVNDSSGVAGLVFPGDRVDVILTHSLQEIMGMEPIGERRRASETVLTDVRILAVDQMIDNVAGTPHIARTATLELTPHEVEVVQVMMQLGSLSLSLRSLATEESNDQIAQFSSTNPFEAMEQQLFPDHKHPRSVQGSVEPRQTYTLDSDVSVLLTPPRAPLPEPVIEEQVALEEPEQPVELPEAEPVVAIFRGHSAI